jgi:putative ABC transport system permease protein
MRCDERVMKLRRSLKPSIRALLAHRTRALLALLSISVGVAAVVATSAIGTGAEQQIVRRIENVGSNLLVVRPAQVKRSVARKDVRGVVTTLEMEDRDAIAALPLVANAAPGAERTLRVKSGSVSTATKVLGSTPVFPEVRRFRVIRGRFFDDEDNREARRVAVLGARVREALFGSDNPVGSDIRIRGVPFEVIGVLDAKGALGDGGDEDNQVLIPIRTALRRVINETWLNEVFVSVADLQRMEDAQKAIGDLLRTRDRHRVAQRRDDFEIQNVTRFLVIQKQAADSLRFFTMGLGALALIVGGTGILALMLMSVRERASEIGLRMAVGARPRDVLVQFLFEATLLALGGWTAGALLAALAAVIVASTTSWSIAPPLDALVASLAMALIIGLGFGAYPARAASRVPPIEALRAE